MGQLARVIAFLFFGLVYVSYALPVRQVGQPSTVPIPDPVESTSPSTPSTPPSTTTPSTTAPSTIPSTTNAPTTSPIIGSTSPTPSSSPILPATSSVTPSPAAAAIAPESPEPSPDDDDDDDDGLAGWLIAVIVIAAVVACLLCLLVLKFCCFRNRDSKSNEDQQPAVYSSSDAAATPPPPPPPAVVPAPPPFSKDEARELGPSSGGGMEPTVVATPAPDQVGDPGDSLLAPSPAMPVVAPVPRGPTPPPHDYVIGAGPAATRSAFDDLHARFEREETGDNSAVLGVDRAGQAPPSIMGPERSYENEGVIAEGMEGHGIEPPPAFPASGIDDQVGRGIDYGDEYSSGAPGRTAGGELLPDREDLSVPTFETQEQLAGGDGSGAISNAPVNVNNTTIAEEGGDVPSLERDPINYNRNAAV